MSNTIVLIGCGRHEEYPADAALTPGHLLKLNSSGEVLKHATEGGFTERLFAKEDALQGRTIATAYAEGEIVSVHVGAPGDVVYAFIKAGENIAVGDALISAGDGTLIKDASVTSGTSVKQVVGIALAALDLSGTGDVSTRVAVRLV